MPQALVGKRIILNLLSSLASCSCLFQTATQATQSPPVYLTYRKATIHSQGGLVILSRLEDQVEMKKSPIFQLAVFFLQLLCKCNRVSSVVKSTSIICTISFLRVKTNMAIRQPTASHCHIGGFPFQYHINKKINKNKKRTQFYNNKSIS